MTVVCFRVGDVETTGFRRDDGAQICEIGWADVRLDTDTKATEVTPPTSLLFSVDAMPIEALATHHITLRMLAGAKPCTEADLRLVATAVGPFGTPAFFVAHNVSMEAQWFTPEVLGAVRPICTMKVAARGWPNLPTFSNHGVRYGLGLEELPPEHCLPAHRAGPDAYVTACVLAEMLKTVRVAEMVRWTIEPRFYPTCPMGKHRGKPWADIEASYLEWITRTPDLEADVQHAARAELDRRRNPQQTAPSGGTETAS